MKAKQLLLAPLLVSLLVLGMHACKKQSVIDPAAVVTAGQAAAGLTAQQLAVRYTSPIGNDYPALVEKYRQLGLDDLKQFWVEISRINSQGAGITMAQTKEITDRVEMYNNIGLRKFATPYNKLNSSQVQDIFFKEVAAKNPNIDNWKPPIDPPPPPACIQYSYPYQFFSSTQSGMISPAAAFYTDVNDPIPDPNYSCPAVEYSFSGLYWGAMYALTPLGASALAANNTSGWKVRQADGYTKVFAPKQFLVAWGLATPTNFNTFSNHIRLIIPAEE